MAKKRVHEIAKEKGITSKEVLVILQKAGIDAKAAASSVDVDEAARAFAPPRQGKAQGRRPRPRPRRPSPLLRQPKAKASCAHG